MTPTNNPAISNASTHQQNSAISQTQTETNSPLKEIKIDKQHFKTGVKRFKQGLQNFNMHACHTGHVALKKISILSTSAGKGLANQSSNLAKWAASGAQGVNTKQFSSELDRATGKLTELKSSAANNTEKLEKLNSLSTELEAFERGVESSGEPPTRKNVFSLINFNNQLQIFEESLNTVDTIHVEKIETNGTNLKMSRLGHSVKINFMRAAALTAILGKAIATGFNLVGRLSHSGSESMRAMKYSAAADYMTRTKKSADHEIKSTKSIINQLKALSDSNTIELTSAELDMLNKHDISLTQLGKQIDSSFEKIPMGTDSLAAARASISNQPQEASTTPQSTNTKKMGLQQSEQLYKTFVSPKRGEQAFTVVKSGLQLVQAERTSVINLANAIIAKYNSETTDTDNDSSTSQTQHRNSEAADRGATQQESANDLDSITPFDNDSLSDLSGTQSELGASNLNGNNPIVPNTNEDNVDPRITALEARLSSLQSESDTDSDNGSKASF